jgi:hypothetical protein
MILENIFFDLHQMLYVHRHYIFASPALRLAGPSCCRLFSAQRSPPPSPPATVLSELSQLPSQLREQLRPLPDLPGIVQTSLIDPEGWRERSASEVELAFKVALWMGLKDYGNLLCLLVGRPASFPVQEAPPQQQAAEAGEQGSEAGAAAPAASLPGSLPSSEAIRAATLQAASRLGSLSRDEELRRRVAAMGSEALTLTRECLDEFLAGYEVRGRAQ